MRYFILTIGLFFSALILVHCCSCSGKQSAQPETIVDDANSMNSRKFGNLEDDKMHIEEVTEEITDRQFINKHIGTLVPGRDKRFVSPVTTLTDDRSFENYLKFLEEYLKLLRKFDAIYERLRRDAIIIYHDARQDVDFERWKKEYYQPLSEKSRKAMTRIMRADDYLFLWENNIPRNIGAYIFVLSNIIS